jgi:fatty-acyl-CoA synthase
MADEEHGQTVHAESRKWLSSTFADALAWGARTHAQREALVHGARRLSYAQLASRADRFAAGLLEAGVRPGDRVAVWLPDCVEWMVARWAVPSIGAILVPVNTRFRADDLGYALRQSGAVALILADRFGSVSYLDVLHTLVPDLAAQPPGDWRSAEWPDLRLVVGTAESMPPGIVPMTHIEEVGARRLAAGRSLDAIRAAIGPDDIAQILFTSGTTSFPKGAMLRHGALLFSNFNTLERMRLGPQDRCLMTTPLFSATGTAMTLSTFFAGGCLVLADGFAAEAFCELVERERITQTFFVEPIVHDLRAYAQLGRHDLRSLRTGTGAPLSRESFRWLVEDLGVRELTNVFGLSESSNACFRTFCTEPLEQRIVSSGPPMPGVSVRIDDLDTGRPLPPGEIGEIRIKGPTVMAGYFRMPEQTAQAIDAEGWLRTGDLGELTADGRLIFRGRLKEMIKPGGFNVATLEIEEFIKRVPGVREAVVVGVPDERLGEVGYAFVERHPGVDVSADAIGAHCRARIASYKVPRIIEFVTEWPMTSTGKVRKLELKARAAATSGQGPLASGSSSRTPDGRSPP